MLFCDITLARSDQSTLFCLQNKHADIPCW